MRAEEILGVEAVRFIEPSFADLTDSHFTAVLASFRGDQARLLIDENEDPLALAFHNDGTWDAGTFLCRKPSSNAIERFEEVSGEIYQEERTIWAAAVREYYSLQIVLTSAAVRGSVRRCSARWGMPRSHVTMMLHSSRWGFPQNA
ncbi:MAG: hypothetical protein NTW33_12410 [Methanoregula sp.]|nr:hypothetical protein [Methanoregula sp.]